MHVHTCRPALECTVDAAGHEGTRGPSPTTPCSVPHPSGLPFGSSVFNACCQLPCPLSCTAASGVTVTRAIRLARASCKLRKEWWPAVVVWLAQWSTHHIPRVECKIAPAKQRARWKQVARWGNSTLSPCEGQGVLQARSSHVRAECLPGKKTERGGRWGENGEGRRGAHAERKGPGRAAGVRAGRGGEEGQEGAVELRGRSGAEIGRGRVPCSGSKTSDAGFTRARGDARRQDGRLRHPSCCTEVWAWRCRPLVTVEAPQRRSSLVSKYTRLRSVGAVAPWPRPPVAESCVVVSRRLMCRGAPNPCTSNTAHARRVQGRGPIAHCVWPPFFHHTWPAGQHVCARDSRRRICCAGGGQLSPRSRV